LHINDLRQGVACHSCNERGSRSLLGGTLNYTAIWVDRLGSREPKAASNAGGGLSTDQANQLKDMGLCIAPFPSQAIDVAELSDNLRAYHPPVARCPDRELIGIRPIP